jgi:pSer/pThr/pTyr-binding forkhead associated (FHA) protein
MPRCTHCGKVNREGSLFCQNCGHKMDGTGGRAETADPACGSCGARNPPGMNFCKMCGAPLLQKSALGSESPSSSGVAGAPMASSAAPVSKLACPSCSKATPIGFAFCQHCGQRIAPAFDGKNPSNSPAGAASTALGGWVAPTPPAGLSRVTTPSPVSDRPASGSALDGTSLSPAPALAQTDPAGIPRSVLPGAALQSVTPKSTTGNNFGILVSVNRDGSDGAKVIIDEEQFDIGRTEGALLFAADPHLGSRHIRLSANGGGKVVLHPLDKVNGVYLRVPGDGLLLSPGDQFILGKELLRFEVLLPEERDPPQLVEHGVRLFGTYPRETWGRLRQMTIAGTSRDVWHLVKPELILGREEGDITFPDDEFMSRRHAAMKRTGMKMRLEDLDSSNGTYLRVRGERELKSGDTLRLGDQLLRFES